MTMQYNSLNLSGVKLCSRLNINVSITKKNVCQWLAAFTKLLLEERTTFDFYADETLVRCGAARRQGSFTERNQIVEVSFGKNSLVLATAYLSDVALGIVIDVDHIDIQLYSNISKEVFMVTIGFSEEFYKINLANSILD